MPTRTTALLQDLGWLGLVVVCAGLALRSLDVLPQSLAEPPEGRRFATLAEVEQRLGEHLALPAYFPETLRWPPTRINVVGRRPAAVVLAFAGADGRERLLLGQRISGVDPLPPALWPPAEVSSEGAVAIGAVDGQVSRLHGADGRVWYEVRWERWDRALALRAAAPLPEVLQLARSVRRRR